MGIRTRHHGRDRTTVAASEEPSCPPLPPDVVAGRLSPFEGLSAGRASSQRRDAAPPAAPSITVGRCGRPMPPLRSSRPVVAVMGSSPIDHIGMIQ